MLENLFSGGVAAGRAEIISVLHRRSGPSRLTEGLWPERPMEATCGGAKTTEEERGVPARECGHPRAVPTSIESGPTICVWVTTCPDCGSELIQEFERPQD